jgi:hypothetical protein
MLQMRGDAILEKSHTNDSRERTGEEGEGLAARKKKRGPTTTNKKRDKEVQPQVLYNKLRYQWC